MYTYQRDIGGVGFVGEGNWSGVAKERNGPKSTCLRTVLGGCQK